MFFGTSQPSRRPQSRRNSLSLNKLQHSASWCLSALLLAASSAASAQAPVAAPAAPIAIPSTSATPTSPQTNTPGSTPNGTQNTSSDPNRADRGRDEQDGRRVAVAGRQEDLTEFQQMVFATTGRNLPIFGASLFAAPPTTFAPVSDVNVGPGYIIGPGDELRLQISGQVNSQFAVTVDRTGSIALPEVGTVHVAGLPFGQLTNFLRQQLGTMYRNFNLNVQMGSLRTIQVFVVGQARQPGSYSISSLSTLLNALFVSGGPTAQGSLRNIQVRRGGETITHFDLYDLLLHGDKSHDISLSTGDVIFIPTVGPQVAVLGSISTPAIYELKGETSTVPEVLRLAGGETNVAATAAVRLERVYEHTMRDIVDVPSPMTSAEVVRDGDILSVASIVDRFRNAVTLRGNVANPGRYVWRPGMRILDLIPNKEALVTRNYWRKRNLLGQQPIDYADQSQQGEGALRARGGAAPAVNSAANTQRGSTSPSTGGGSSVGNALAPENSVFSAQTDVILSAPDIDWNYAVIERQSTVDLTTSLIPFNLGKLVLEGDASQNLELQPGDVVTIFSKADLRVPSMQQTRYVRLEGEFIGAGVYSVLPGETLRSLLRRAGGFTPDAYLFGSEFTRESTRRLQQQRLSEYADQLEAQASSINAQNQARAVSASDQTATAASAEDARLAVNRLRSLHPIGRIVLDLKPASEGIDAVPDLALEDGDRFVVPRIPSNITVEGQVYSANAFVYTSGRRVLDYLKEAGGPDRQADRKRMFVLRADGSVISRQYANVEKAPMFPGDTIVVPPVIDKRSVIQRFIDVATIVGQFGIGAAAIAVLSR